MRLWFYYLTSYCVPCFEGTCLVHIDSRKNDMQRKGHYPALVRSMDPSLDTVTQLREWMQLTGLHVRKDCPKLERPAARCSCRPLFPTTRCAEGGVTVVTDQPASRSDWIRWAVTQAGGESHRLSGISARKGGISVAIDADVDEAILYLQSGHGQALPAREYMQICAPGRFLETFEAFGL